MGGTLTLVGTSTNLIVNSILLKMEEVSLGMFEFAKYGWITLIVGLYMFYGLPRKSYLREQLLQA